MRRLLLRVRSLVRPPALSVVYHERYASALSGVPTDPDRGALVLAFLMDHWLVRPRDVHRPRPAALSHVLRVHREEYLASLQDPAVVTAIFGAPVGEAQAPALVEAQRLAAGGTILATTLALTTHRPVAHLGGGLHHAGPARGTGFCVFNDVAIAVRRLQAVRGFTDRVLVIDLDLHHGNGTRAIFAADANVHTYSVHNTSWDDSPAVAATDLALGTGVDDDAYLRAVRDSLPAVLESHRPALIYYLAGTDPAADDALGDWRVSAEGLLARDRFVVEQVRRACGPRVPLVILLGGGYGHGAWRHTARFLAWLAGGRAIEPPDDMVLTLQRYRPVIRRLDRRLSLDAASQCWELSVEDLGLAPGAEPRETRILGRYTAHGFELLLERVGALQRLRTLGFTAPTVEVDFGAGLGQTVRVFGEAERRNLLIEMRLRRDRRVVSGCEVLFVEWLLLQNPRAAFAERRPPMPGQHHPGLGLLGVIVGLLVLIAEQIGLDAVVDVPAHYYVAAIGRHHMRFLEPGAQARFEALVELLEPLPLVEADRALAEGRVVDEVTGGTVRWEPAPMVIPVSPRLKEQLGGTVRLAQEREAISRLRLRAR
jgi:acetoin utilization deacetylase AcuC-like enzyme